MPAGKITFSISKNSHKSGNSSSKQSLLKGRIRNSSSLGEKKPIPGEVSRDFEIIIPKSCSSEYSSKYLQYIEFLSKSKKKDISEQKTIKLQQISQLYRNWLK
jgi:hypothetical protein